MKRSASNISLSIVYGRFDDLRHCEHLVACQDQQFKLRLRCMLVKTKVLEARGIQPIVSNILDPRGKDGQVNYCSGMCRLALNRH